MSLRSSGLRKKIRRAERRQTHCVDARTQAACGTRHGVRRLAPPSACGRARLPAFHLRFSPSGTFVPKAQRRARLPERRNIKQRTCRTRRHFGHSDAPRAPVVVPAGMMPEPPGSGVYLSARGRRTRSTVRKYPPGRRPLTSEIGGVYCRRFRQVKGVGNYADEINAFRACASYAISARHSDDLHRKAKPRSARRRAR